MTIERYKLTTARPNRDATRWGGAACSSVETSVMEVERRGSVRMTTTFMTTERDAL